MSLFFLISGYFVVMSCDAKGPLPFIRSRLLRLGIPALAFALIMIPLQVYVFAPEGQRGHVFPLEVGHLWFLEHLLLFSVVYALWRMARQRRAVLAPRQLGTPSYLAVLAFIPVLAITSAIVRIGSPIDKWTYLLGFFRVAFADVPRDLAFFVIGLVAYHQRWIERFPTRTGLVWLLVGVLAAALWYAYALRLYAVWSLSDTAMGILYPIWEAILCCGMCIGLLVLFREKLDVQTRLSRAMAQSQYAAYIFHVPIVLLFQVAVAGLAVPPFIKFALVTLVSVPAVFWFSNWVRQPLHL